MNLINLTSMFEPVGHSLPLAGSREKFLPNQKASRPVGVGLSHRGKLLPLPLRAVTWLLVIVQLQSAVPVMGAAMDAWQNSVQMRRSDRADQTAAISLTPAPSLWANREEEKIGLCKLFAE